MFKKIIAKLILIVATITLLAGCGNKANWDVKVNLTPVEKQRAEAEMKEAKKVIAEQQKENKKDRAMAYVVLARAHEKLGDRRAAAKVYTDAIDYGIKSIIIHNNLGKLYERVGEYKKAIEQYNILISKFNEQKYNYDIAGVYIKLKDAKNAQKYYDIWKEKMKTSDTVIEKEIKEL